jgi:chromosome segregation ATPase
MRFSELEDVSMPELWQMADRLGISKKGEKTELIKRILEAQRKKEADLFEKLKAKMKEHEKNKEELRTLIESASNLTAELNRNRRALEQSIREEREKIEPIDRLIHKLEKKKEELQEKMQRKEEEISQIDDQITFLSSKKASWLTSSAESQ